MNSYPVLLVGGPVAEVSHPGLGGGIGCAGNKNISVVPYLQSASLNTPQRYFHTNGFENAPWLILQTPEASVEKISVLKDKVKYLAILPNLEGVIVLIDNGSGILQPQSAFHIAHNAIFVFNDAEKNASVNPISLVLYRNPVLIFSTSSENGEGIMFTTADVASFLYTIGENHLIKSMLEADGCYAIVDRYIVAMAFVYLKRAKLSTHFVSNVVFALAGMLLAHKLEEDEAPGRSLLKLIHHCLPKKVTEKERFEFIRSVISYQTQVFKKIKYRGFISVEECENVICVAPFHPIWRRWRLAFHGGAVRDSLHMWKLDFINSSGGVYVSSREGESKCVMCKGNSVYCSSVSDRYYSSCNFLAQRTHLTNILHAISEIHNINLGMALQCTDIGLFLKGMTYNLSNDTVVDQSWPLEYQQLLSIEDQIEVVLANENYLQKCLAIVKMQKLQFALSYM